MLQSRIEVPVTERRANSRFPMQMDLRYRYAHRRTKGRVHAGVIEDISSSGLRFTAEEAVEVGRRLEVSMDWPVRLDGAIPLQMVVTGTVVRCSGAEVALRIHSHEFKTRCAEGHSGAANHADHRELAYAGSGFAERRVG